MPAICFRRTLAIASLVACAGGCSPTPILLAPGFEAHQTSRFGKLSPKVAPCRVQIASVEDKRSNSETMGELSYRPIHASDVVGWVRSGFQSLERDPRLALVQPGSPGAPELTLHVELDKAYVNSAAGMSKAADVVVRVRYGRNEEPETEQWYRGEYTGVNWAASTGETEAALNSAFEQLLKDVDNDIVSRCAAKTTSTASTALPASQSRSSP